MAGEMRDSTCITESETIIDNLAKANAILEELLGSSETEPSPANPAGPGKIGLLEGHLDEIRRQSFRVLSSIENLSSKI